MCHVVSAVLDRFLGDTENAEFEILSGSIEISAILFGVVRVLSNYISITIKLHLSAGTK